MTAPTPDFTGLADRIDGCRLAWWGDGPFDDLMTDAVAALRHAADLERAVDELRRHRYTEVKTVDAIDRVPVNAMMSNKGWELLHVGMGSGGQTTLTFGWPSRPAAADQTGAET